MADKKPFWAKKKRPGPKPKAQVKKVHPPDLKLLAFVAALKEEYLEENGHDIDGKTLAANILAEGYTIKEAAKEANTTERTIYRWKLDTEFMNTVDELTVVTGIAVKAERIRIAKRVVRAIEKHAEDLHMPVTQKDILDWLKYSQQEMEGLRLLTDDQLDKIATLFFEADNQATADGGSGEIEGEATDQGAGSGDQEHQSI
ncbi:MAG: helix-turn-helix domain containing protein [Anaerolineaceae bacterium]|nr:helix-turn-helix domain containing protein [Anaerolineaceae bacterium]